MSPLDRIVQLTQENRSMETAALRLADDFDKLTEENRQLSRSVDLLRSQLADARKQLEADSQTIAKLAKDKRELLRMVSLCASEFASLAPHLGNVYGTWESTQEKAETALLKFGPVDSETVNEYLSRHA